MASGTLTGCPLDWSRTLERKRSGSSSRYALSGNINALYRARAKGVEVAVAYRHPQNNTARFLIESRAPAPRRGSARPGLSPVEALYVLQEKWNPPRKEAASERVAHWGAHVVGVVAGLAWVGRNLDGRTTVTSSQAQSHGRSSIPPLARMAEEDW